MFGLDREIEAAFSNKEKALFILVGRRNRQFKEKYTLLNISYFNLEISDSVVIGSSNLEKKSVLRT